MTTAKINTVADFLLQRLREWGVQHVFGYPGDGINGILTAFGRAENDPAFIQSRHEEMSAFNAVGYAKFAGQVGVCLATSGPGAIHLLNGLYDAKLDHVPVVAIVGQTARTAMGGSYQQEVDLHTLFQNVSGYVETVTVPQQLPNVLDRAFKVALSRRTATTVIVHADVQELEYAPPSHEFKMVPSSPAVPAAPIVTPNDAAVRAAADVLNSGEKVAILVGNGARAARDEVQQVAEVLGAGVAKALLGKDVLPDDLPYVTGAIGLLGTRPSYELMRDCDTLLTVGSSFPYSQFLPEPGSARGVQIDIDPTMIGMRYPNEINLVGDAKATLQKLIPLLIPKLDSTWRKQVEGNVEAWWDSMAREARVEADPINPMHMVSELSRRLPYDALVTADSGTAATWYARQIKIRGDMRGSLSGTLASMGNAVPYAIGAKFGQPHRLVVALEGDGAMQMNGLAELITVARYWHEWSDPRFVVAVLHNNDLSQVTWELRSLGGSPKLVESQTLPTISYAEVAKLYGVRGIVVDRPEDVGPAWDEALTAQWPVLLDVHVDSDVPPIPPHATWEQMKDTAAALLKGDEDAWGVVREGVRTKTQELLGRKDP